MIPRWDRAVRPRGFSLAEMIVVLLLVASVLAITLPALFRPLGKADLREAAKQVQAALLEARTRAVESGVVHEFRYEPEGRRYEIIARSDADDAGLAATPNPTARALSPPPDPSLPEPLRDTLPDGIVFADPLERERTEPLAPSATEELVIVEDAVTGERWSAPLRFYPNGRGRNARLTLCGGRSWSIEIVLRGLTGMALIGEPRHEETEQEAPLSRAPQSGRRERGRG